MGAATTRCRAPRGHPASRGGAHPPPGLGSPARAREAIVVAGKSPAAISAALSGAEGPGGGPPQHHLGYARELCPRPHSPENVSQGVLPFLWRRVKHRGRRQCEAVGCPVGRLLRRSVPRLCPSFLPHRLFRQSWKRRPGQRWGTQQAGGACARQSPWAKGGGPRGPFALLSAHS